MTMATSNNDQQNTAETSNGPVEASEEAVKRSMKPLESRTAIPGNNERKEANPESAETKRDDKEDEIGEGFIDITNDAGEIE